MSAQQELISAVRSMQANAQASLPVIPNNGNPGGAYNAPRPVNPGGGMARKAQDFSWLEPSPAMQQLTQMLGDRQQYLNTRLGEIRQQPLPQPNMPLPVPQPQQMPQQLPTMPMQRFGGGVRLPQASGPVLPSSTGIIPNSDVLTRVPLPITRGM